MQFHSLVTALVVIAGLLLFEVVNSLDNAVVNSAVLSRITNPRAKRFFVTWGLFSSVFLVRGILPFVIYYVPNQGMGFRHVMSSFWSGDPAVRQAVADVAPSLLMAGGVFLSMLFLHWLLVEEKDLGYAFEMWLSKQGQAWYQCIVGVWLLTVCLLARRSADPSHASSLMLAAVVGASAYFVVNGIKEFAESSEEKLIEESGGGAAIGDWGKVLFLEAIDASFSFDGVVGAFAFTLVVPYILIGNGIGAYVVRQLTLGSVEKIGNYKLLANGAFYSIGSLSLLMIAKGFGLQVPEWLSPAVTFGLVGFFFFKSIRLNRDHSQVLPVTGGAEGALKQ